MSFLRHARSIGPMWGKAVVGPRLAFASRWSARARAGSGARPRPRPCSSSTMSRTGYSLAGCSPAEPASASPAGIHALPTGRNSQPPPDGGWGIFDRRFGEFSTGVDSTGVTVGERGRGRRIAFAV